MAEQPHLQPKNAYLNWLQGDFALGVGPFLFGDLPEVDEKEAIGAAYLAQDPVGFVVVSQTCDIVSHPKRLPTVAVCPLIEVDSSHRKMIGRGQAPRFGIVENAPEGVVVDFASPMSISKELLGGWSRSQGFCDQQLAMNFARGLERVYGRFAFPDEFNESIRQLERQIKSKYGKHESLFGKAVRSLQELRVRPDPSWDADEVRIIFMLIFSASSKREIEPKEIQSQFQQIIEKLDWVKPFKLAEASVRIGDYDDFSARLYMESVPLDLNALSFAANNSRK